MPKVKRLTVPIADSVDEVKRLAEVLWKSGDINTPACQKALREAGFDPDKISPVLLHNAEEANDERFREAFRGTNADPNSRLKVVIPGDSEFDPALNANHPIKGAAAIKEKSSLQEPVSGSSGVSKPKPKLQLIRNSGNTSRKELERDGLVEPKKPARKLANQGRASSGRMGRPIKFMLLGHSAAAVFRWMGANGWSLEEALKVSDHYNVGCSYFTVRGQLWFGDKGQGGPLAELTEEQIAEISAIAGR